MAPGSLSKLLRVSASARTHFGEAVDQPGGSRGPRIQADFQIIAVLRGEARVRVDGEHRRIAAGHAGLFLPGGREQFQFSRRQATHHRWCSVGASLEDQALAGALRQTTKVIALPLHLTQLIELGLSMTPAAVREAPELLDTLGRAVLQDYVLAAGHPQGLAADRDAIRRAFDWIGQNLDQQIDVFSLARAAGVSRAQLAKLFQRHVGLSPMRSVWRARTERGAQLLRETGLTVSEIAERVGFATPFHFSRWVRSAFGESPRALRGAAWNRPRPEARSLPT